MRAPGDLDELGPAGASAWESRVADMVRIAEVDSGGLPIATLDPRANEVRAIDWPAFPVRVSSALGAEPAMEVLDWRRGGRGDTGRARHQEEYAEWRIVRRRGRAVGFELTTELPEYWEVLAAHEPQRALELVASFAGQERVPTSDIYGELDPLHRDTTPEQRRAAFAVAMLTDADRLTKPRDVDAPPSPFNDGRLAICCLVQHSNTLAALLRLLATSRQPCLVIDALRATPRYASGSEVIALLGTSACDGRHSDPILVERISRFTTEGRAVGLDDPAGVYIRQVQSHELRLPDGSMVPASWFVLGRGVSEADAADGRARHQRLTFMLPPDTGLALDDLVIARTGEQLRHGGQLAELVELAVYLRVGHPQAIADPSPHNARLIPTDRDAAPAISLRQLRSQAMREAADG